MTLPTCTSWRVCLSALVWLLAPQAGRGVAVDCYEAYRRDQFNKTFNGTGCPASCPVKSDCTRTRTFQCVAPSDCAYLHGGGRALLGNESKETDGSGQCLSCTITGCAVCESKSLCRKCEDGYDLTDGGKYCLYGNRFAWFSVLPVVGAFGLWAFVDFCRAHCRANVNPGAVEAGLLHRFRMKVRQPTEGNPRYGLLKVPLHSKSIIGPDVALFMNWFGLVGTIAAYMTVLAYIFQPEYQASGVEDLCTRVRQNIPSSTRRLVWLLGNDWTDGYGAEGSSGRRLYDTLTASYQSYEVPNATLWTGLAYVGCVFISALFLKWQQANEEHLREAGSVVPMLHRYAVELSGLPEDATDHKELEDYVREAASILLGLPARGAVEYVSICYDYREKEESVQTLIDMHLSRAETDHRALATPQPDACSDSTGGTKMRSKAPTVFQRTMTKLSRGETKLLGAVLRSGNKNGDEPMPAISEEDGKGGHAAKVAGSAPVERSSLFWIETLGYIFLGTNFQYGCLQMKGHSHSTPVEEPSEKDARELLESLRCSGFAVIVLRTESLRRALAQAERLPNNFRELHIIRVTALLEEPCSMQWPFYTRSVDFYRRLGLTFLTLIGVLILWVLLYGPWASFSVYAFDDTSQMVFLVGTLMGVVVAMGNAILAYTIVGLSNHVGFTHESQKRLFQLLVIIPCIVINVVCDFAVIARTAYWKYNSHLPSDSALQINFGLRLMEADVFALLVPGYCLLPYILEPMVTVMLPLWVAIWRVKTDPTITPDHAERLMQAPEVDIINPPLCDLIVVTSTFFMTFLSPSKHHGKLFGALLGFACFTYCMNRVRILRWHTVAYYSTTTLNKCEMYLWGLPLAILAAAFGGNFGSSFGMHFVVASMSFFLHLTAHVIFVRYVLRSASQSHRIKTETYGEVASRVVADYRNTNPVEVLKDNLCRTEALARHAADVEAQEASRAAKAAAAAAQALRPSVLGKVADYVAPLAARCGATRQAEALCSGMAGLQARTSAAFAAPLAPVTAEAPSLFDASEPGGRRSEPGLVMFHPGREHLQPNSLVRTKNGYDGIDGALWPMTFAPPLVGLPHVGLPHVGFHASSPKSKEMKDDDAETTQVGAEGSSAARPSSPGQQRIAWEPSSAP